MRPKSSTILAKTLLTVEGSETSHSYTSNLLFSLAVEHLRMSVRVDCKPWVLMSHKASLAQPAAANARATAAPIPAPCQFPCIAEMKLSRQYDIPEAAPVITATPWKSV